MAPGADLQRSPAEPSPYSPVSRLFWFELYPRPRAEAHRPTPVPDHLGRNPRVTLRLRSALAAPPPRSPQSWTKSAVRYARLPRSSGWEETGGTGRPARAGADAHQMDPEEERFHLVAQTLARRQLRDLRQRLDHDGFRLGLDLAVGGHPDGYDPWSRQSLFGEGMSVGAPPDRGSRSGQDWSFSPVLPEASRQRGPRYLELRSPIRPGSRECSGWTTLWRGLVSTGSLPGSACTTAPTCRIVPRSCSPS